MKKSSVPLFRRFAALLYDSFLMISIWILSSFPYLYLLGHEPHTFFEVAIFRLYLWVIGFCFVGFFWIKAGQTLGMKAWGLSVTRTTDDKELTLRDAISRYCLATLGILGGGMSYVFALLHPQHITLHDLLSKTQLKYSS
jgi:uncharacterized RDD family membrane protein YckC